MLPIKLNEIEKVLNTAYSGIKHTFRARIFLTFSNNFDVLDEQR